jgi:hypothetical protein
MSKTNRTDAIPSATKTDATEADIRATRAAINEARAAVRRQISVVTNRISLVEKSKTSAAVHSPPEPDPEQDGRVKAILRRIIGRELTGKPAAPQIERLPALLQEKEDLLEAERRLNADDLEAEAALRMAVERKIKAHALDVRRRQGFALIELARANADWNKVIESCNEIGGAMYVELPGGRPEMQPGVVVHILGTGTNTIAVILAGFASAGILSRKDLRDVI